jgi:signal transduction histidine kinase
MFSSLYSRITLLLFSIFLILAGFFFLFFEQASRSTQNETSQKLYLQLAENIVNDLGVISNNHFDLKLIEEAFRTMMILGPNIELYVLDRTGKVITYSVPDARIKRTQINLQPIINFIDHKQRLPILGDDPRAEKRQKIFSAAAVYEENNSIGNKVADKTLIGYLYIIIGGEDYDSILTALRLSNAWQIGIFGVASALGFLLIASLLLFYVLTRPLRQLTKEIKAFEKSDFTVSAPRLQLSLLKHHNNDEIHQLRQSFQQMQQRIMEQLEHLKKNDAIRREFLAYVSHDLRTPLAGMKAYLETLEIKQASMNNIERQQFISKAISNGDRLQGMINELFELTRLENHQVELHQEAFAMGDLLSDIYASLEDKARQKQVHLQIDFQQASVQVIGDIAKIERVIQNLTENAIRYSEVNSTVLINTKSIKNNKLRVSICDHGAGIQAHDLPYIFEPYFRASDEYRLKHKGAGLGLAISQRLLRLQDINLQVESEINKGTTFYFSLQKV